MILRLLFLHKLLLCSIVMHRIDLPWMYTHNAYGEAHRRTIISGIYHYYGEAHSSKYLAPHRPVRVGITFSFRRNR